MSLEEYWRKRDFVKSSEPKGEIGMIKEEIDMTKGKIKEGGEDKEKTIISLPIFVVQEHHATRLHYDLRLEMDGVLRSWAIPKGIPEESGIRRLAIQTEDHPIEYANFEGEIPEGMYGAGRVIIWDKGEFLLEEETDKKLVFQLKGKKLIGKYTMIKIMLKGKESWLLSLKSKT